MALSDMQVFNEYVMPATMITLQQEIEKFNAASGGSILLSTDGMTGSYMQESFWASLQAARRRVDRTAANGAQAATPLTELVGTKVKIAGGFGPVSYEPSQMTWLRRPTQEGVEAAATAFAQLLVQDQLNTAIAAGVAAIENNVAVVNDVSATGPVTYDAMNLAQASFGDMSGQIVANVMTGAMAHKLIGQNLANAERLYTAGNVRVIDILGQTSVITDAPALYEAGTPNKNKVLGLVAGALQVADAADIITNVQTSNGQERIETTFQADYAFSVGVKGYSWDVTNGGESPNDAEIATGSNWDKYAEFDKATAGVMAIGDAA